MLHAIKEKPDRVNISIKIVSGKFFREIFKIYGLDFFKGVPALPSGVPAFAIRSFCDNLWLPQNFGLPYPHAKKYVF